jgi:hypothetical protein
MSWSSSEASCRATRFKEKRIIQVELKSANGDKKASNKEVGCIHKWESISVFCDQLNLILQKSDFIPYFKFGISP